jgi:hypothetical protein
VESCPAAKLLDVVSWSSHVDLKRLSSKKAMLCEAEASSSHVILKKARSSSEPSKTAMVCRPAVTCSCSQKSMIN